MFVFFSSGIVGKNVELAKGEAGGSKEPHCGVCWRGTRCRRQVGVIVHRLNFVGGHTPSAI